MCPSFVGSKTGALLPYLLVWPHWVSNEGWPKGEHYEKWPLFILT